MIYHCKIFFSLEWKGTFSVEKHEFHGIVYNAQVNVYYTILHKPADVSAVYGIMTESLHVFAAGLIVYKDLPHD